MDLLLIIIASYFIINKTKLEWALVIIMALGTNLFQASKIFKGILLFPNITDAALLLIILLFFIFKRQENPNIKPIYQTTMLLLIYVACVAIIDIIINGTSFISVLKTSRHWLCLLAIFVIPQIPYNTLCKSLKIVFYFTIIISSINIVEFLFGTSYFTKTIVEGGIKRGALPSYYALFYTFLIFTDYYKFSKIKKYLFLGILIASLLVSTTRSISLAVVLGIAICIWYLSNNKLSSYLKLCGLCVVIYLASFALPSLNRRFNDAFKEIAGIEQSSKNLDTEGNMTFRLYMLIERYQYIRNNTQFYAFGIGNVIEQNFPTTFTIGLYDEEMQRPTQLDTGDISWTLIILRLGMIGLIIYLCFIFRFILFKHQIPKDKLLIATKAYLISNLLIISFAGSYFARGEFWIMPIICISIISKSITAFKKNKI